MINVFLMRSLAIIVLLPLGVAADPAAPSVIAKLVGDANRTPPGPVEDDVTSQAVSTCTKAKEGFHDSRSVRELIVASYNDATLEPGPLTCLWAESKGAIWYGKAKLTAAGMAECEEEASSSSTIEVPGRPDVTETGSAPMFGEGGCFSCFVGAKVPHNGQVIATFCVLHQQGGWKVHCVYLSPDVLAGDDKIFVVREFGAFVRKQ
jgi:hypothetical protein